jgi:hypothetical protein
MTGSYVGSWALGALDRCVQSLLLLSHLIDFHVAAYRVSRVVLRSVRRADQALLQVNAVNRAQTGTDVHCMLNADDHLLALKSWACGAPACECGPLLAGEDGGGIDGLPY